MAGPSVAKGELCSGSDIKCVESTCPLHCWGVYAEGLKVLGCTSYNTRAAAAHSVAEPMLPTDGHLVIDCLLCCRIIAINPWCTRDLPVCDQRGINYWSNKIYFVLSAWRFHKIQHNNGSLSTTGESPISFARRRVRLTPDKRGGFARPLIYNNVIFGPRGARRLKRSTKWNSFTGPVRENPAFLSATQRDFSLFVFCRV